MIVDIFSLYTLHNKFLLVKYSDAKGFEFLQANNCDGDTLFHISRENLAKMMVLCDKNKEILLDRTTNGYICLRRNEETFVIDVVNDSKIGTMRGVTSIIPNEDGTIMLSQFMAMHILKNRELRLELYKYIFILRSGIFAKSLFQVLAQ